jgi:hypothetical protein
MTRTLYVNEKPVVISLTEEIQPGDYILTPKWGVWEYQPAPCPLPYWGNKSGCFKVLNHIKSN